MWAQRLLCQVYNSQIFAERIGAPAEREAERLRCSAGQTSKRRPSIRALAREAFACQAPGRKSYNGPKDQIEQQITRYLAQLQAEEIESFGRTRIRIANDCVFYCYVVADIVGDLVLQLSGWETTSNGQGRIRPLKGNYRGQIEVLQWQDLVNDAWMRDRATLHAAGLSRKLLTPLQTKPHVANPEDEDIDDE